MARSWVKDNSRIMIGAVWCGYDRLRSDPECLQAIQDATSDVERGITRELFVAIHDSLSHDEPFQLMHGDPEDDSRKPAPARPPEYDIAFKMRANPRVAWPLEAKVLPTAGTLAEYIKALHERFLSGTYSPFIAEGVMIGYLMQGTQCEAFDELATRLGLHLAKQAAWKDRAHRVSQHRRSVARGKHNPVGFRCHHMLMEFAR